MKPVKRGSYSRAHLEELLDEERAKTDQLRGQLQNCVNHLSRAKRQQYSGNSDYDDCIESANKALYETLIK